MNRILLKSQPFSRLLHAVILLAIFGLLSGVLTAKDGSGGSDEAVISNRADATYTDGEGNSFDTVSETVTVTVLRVPGVTVTPDETAPSSAASPNERITRLFQICNTGNSAGTFLAVGGTVTEPAAIYQVYFDADNSGTVTTVDVPVVFGETLTPKLPSGSCYGVLFVLDTNAAAAGSQIIIQLTASSTRALPGTEIFPQDTGTIVNSVSSGVIFTSPNDTALPPVKLVESLLRKTASRGQTLNYTITFRNNGAVNARLVRVVDDLPLELEYVPNTLRLNNRSVTDAADADEGQANGRRLELLIPEIAPQVTTEINFQARLTGAVSGSGVVNSAIISAANAASVNSSNAVAVVEPLGTVYAGHSGGSVRIAGAKLTLSVDESGTPLNLLPNIGFAPNAENINPFNTDANGNFGFALDGDQIGTNGNPARYLLTANAPNYRPRQIEVSVTPSGSDGFYTAAIRALDGQPIAVADGFSLTAASVELRDLAALVFNVPMFELSTLEISKTADKQNADIGDIVSYTVQVKNSSSAALSNVVVRDILPASFNYAAGTAQIQTGSNTRQTEPEIAGNELRFALGDLGSGDSATITYRVRVGANATEGEHINSAVASGVQISGETLATQPAQASVRVRGGVFSMRQVVIGRVFEDRNGNGKFDSGEYPVAGARIYMNNGQSVETDSSGQYNLPTVNHGSLVLSLDPVTLPDNYYLTSEDGRKSADSWTRLLRTPLGGGSLLRQNFAIAPKDKKYAASAEEKFITAKGVFTAKIEKPKSAADKPPIQIASANPKGLLGPPVKKGNSPETARSTETYTVDTAENVTKVAPGNLLVLSPETNSVVMSPALALVARVAKDWTVEADVNGEKIGASNIGETRIDIRSEVATLTFVGISLKPGENAVKLTAVSADGKRGETTTLSLFGRGPAERVEIISKKSNAVNASVDIEIRTFDRWGNPAADGQVSIETSAGRIFNEQAETAANETAKLAKQHTLASTDGKVSVQLISDGTAETAHLKVVTGNRESLADIRFDAELRPTLLVGLGELSFGRNAPEIVNAGDAANFRGRLALYYRGRFLDNNLVTLAYDSQQALNRIAGRDRFGDFDPLDRSYSVFGDSSQRFEDAQSNSKIYARIDRGRSYAMFGDMEAGLEQQTLSGYSRRLTGAKLHLENSKGDFVSVTGARPDTAFVRDVIPGGSLSIVRLSHNDILPGSEIIALETRDRRNPEIILSRETLIRSVDYNLNPLTGELFFLRTIAAFDFQLNLVQIVAAYERRGGDSSNYVYTGRAVKTLRSLGLRFGTSYINQQQGDIGAFQLGGFDLEKTLWNGGKLNIEAAASRGTFASGLTVFDPLSDGFAQNETRPDSGSGTALNIKFDQPVSLFHSSLRANFSRASAGFLNPFGATVTPGSQRLQVNFEMRPSAKRSLTLGFTDERNKTDNVDNSRRTFSFQWSEQWRDNLRSRIGFDHRTLAERTSERSTESNLATAGVEYSPTDKLELSVKREQNLGDADPTYPNQTLFAAKYKLSDNAKLFFTQRLAAAPITPIGDFSNGGFASTGARRETAFGIETKISRLGALNGRYQIENGLNAADGFAVIGLQNRWSVSKQFAIEAGAERGFLVKGNGKSFVSGTFGGEWTPVDGFRASARYEIRDRNGFGQLFSIGAAGKLGDDWTTLARGQFARTNFANRSGSSSNVTTSAAYRPLDSDKYALLFSYNHRDTFQEGVIVNGLRQSDQRDKFDTLSSDGLYQATRNLEVYGRFALRFNGSGDNTTAYSSALTLLGQVRTQQRLSDNFDIAAEFRLLNQPTSNTFRRSAGAELGFWLIPDLRLGGGYNFTRSTEFAVPVRDTNRQFRGGFYFTVTTKLSNIFDLFGTSRSGLADGASTDPPARTPGK